MSDRSFAALALSVTLSLGLVPAPAHTAPAEGWPGTRAGELARGWVSAFSAGEDSMRAFLARNMAARSLGERPLAARVERYRDLKARYGKLQLDRVVKSEPLELGVRLLDGEAKSHEFVFKAQAVAPHKLEWVSIKEPGHGMPGFGAFHH